MNLKFASTCLLLTLMIFVSPAFSHSAHTTIFTIIQALNTF